MSDTTNGHANQDAAAAADMDFRTWLSRNVISIVFTVIIAVAGWMFVRGINGITDKLDEVNVKLNTVLIQQARDQENVRGRFNGLEDKVQDLERRQERIEERFLYPNRND